MSGWGGYKVKDPNIRQAKIKKNSVVLINKLFSDTIIHAIILSYQSSIWKDAKRSELVWWRLRAKFLNFHLSLQRRHIANFFFLSFSSINKHQKNPKNHYLCEKKQKNPARKIGSFPFVPPVRYKYDALLGVETVCTH